MKYTPTEADKQTGRNVRALRRLAGETLNQTIERSGVGFGNSTLSKVELGQRALTLPEATKLAAHFNTTADRIIARPVLEEVLDRYENGPAYTEAELADIERRCAPPVPAVTEQEWLGNDKPVGAPHLFAIADGSIFSPAEVAATDRELVINLDQPLSPAEYREQVWIPYLENRYARDLKQTG